jgi:hypothetical protein
MILMYTYYVNNDIDLDHCVNCLEAEYFEDRFIF